MTQTQNNNEALKCTYKDCENLQTADGEYCEEHYPRVQQDNFLDQKYAIEQYLLDKGFIKIDYNRQRQDIWRQRDNEPKMDIVIEFILHKDNL